jgi:hypothetical protein
VGAVTARRRRPGPRARPRLHFDALEAWLNARYTNTSMSADRQLDGRLSARRIGELVGYHDNPESGRAAVQRWRAAGVPLYAADRAAVHAGAHPLEVWPDFHADLTDDNGSGGTA